MASGVDPEKARRRLCVLGDVLRDTVIASRGIDTAVIEGETEADVIYANPTLAATIAPVLADVLRDAGYRSREI